MYSTFNEGKSVVAERFIRTLKNKLYKHMTVTGKNVYYDALHDVVNEYNNTKHSTIKMKPKDVKNDTAELSTIARNNKVYIDEHNKKPLDIMQAIESEYLNLKIYLLKDVLRIGVEKYSLLIK